jgi:hypothetical protein
MATHRLILSKTDVGKHRYEGIKKNVNKTNKRIYVKNKF